MEQKDIFKEVKFVLYDIVKVDTYMDFGQNP